MQGEGQNSGGSDTTAESFKANNKAGREALQELLDPLFVRFWTDVLNMAYEWFPHERGDGSHNERAFTAIRHRVLRVGNNAKRDMKNSLEAFAVQQIFSRNVEHHSVKGQGPFNLPPGVRMPSERVKA